MIGKGFYRKWVKSIFEQFIRMQTRVGSTNGWIISQNAEILKLYFLTISGNHRNRRDVPANQILQICTKTRDGERPSQEWRRACGRPSTTWTHQICRDTGVTAAEALQLVEDRPFWRTIATAGGSGWMLHVTMMMMMIGIRDVMSGLRFVEGHP